MANVKCFHMATETAMDDMTVAIARIFFRKSQANKVTNV
jgi:hypothetical protein